MTDSRRLLNMSYQRAISPNYESFFNRFYDNLISSNPEIAGLFSNTDMDRQYKMLMQSMTYITSFTEENESKEELSRIAEFHSKDNLSLSTDMYGLWLESLIKTVKEYDPEFNSQVEAAWRKIMLPGLEHMKSFCNK